VIRGFIRLHEDEIEKLHIETHFQGRGIGAELLKFALEEKGAKWLWVLQQNERGAAFYKRYGFDFTGEKFMEDGWIPLLKMSV